MDLIKEVNEGTSGELWSIASTVHFAELYAGTMGDVVTNPTASDLWASDCYRTMAHWLVDHPRATDDEANAQWDIICDRPEGQQHRIVAGFIFCEV